MKSALIVAAMAGLALATARAAEDGRLADWTKTGDFTWTDQETGAQITQITQAGTSNKAIYFHDPCFLDGYLYYRNIEGPRPRACRVNLETLKSEQILPDCREFTISAAREELIYLIGTDLWAKNPATGEERKLCPLPPEMKEAKAGFRMSADGKTLYVAWQDMSSFHAVKSDLDNTARKKREGTIDEIFEARLPNKLWAVDLETGQTKLIQDVRTWLGHFQPSPTDANQLLFCHEGLWNKTQRMWLINRDGSGLQPVFSPEVQANLKGQFSGHEFWAPDGKSVWFDYRKVFTPPDVAYLAQVTLEDEKLHLFHCDPKYWSVHYNVAPDGKLFAGDGGAHHFNIVKEKDGEEYIFLYTFKGDELAAQKVCRLTHNNYTACEPNIRFTPDGKNLIFMATDAKDSTRIQIYRIPLASIKS